MIVIDFNRGNDPYILYDALVLPDDHNLTEEEIEQMKQDRYTTWMDLLNQINEPISTPLDNTSPGTE